MEIAWATIGELLAALQAGELSAVEIVETLLARIAGQDGRLGCYLHVAAEQSRRAAAAMDARRRAGERLGPLAGIPVALKDNFLTRGLPTTAGSRILQGYVPPYDGTAAARLRQAEAILLGKTGMDEFAMGSSSESGAGGPVRNPWDVERVPGGSSGGAAAAVAAGLATAALGTDTGGSVRQPAALCGVVGLKPTYGRVSRYGIVAFASSLDQVGPLARTVEDCARLLQVIGGHDDGDSTCAPRPQPDYLAACVRGVEGMAIGVPREYFAAGLHPEVEAGVRAAIDQLERLGARVRELSLPHTRYAVATYYLVAPAEASANLARYDGVRYGRRAKAPADLDDLYARSRAEGFGPEVTRRIMLGTYALSAGYRERYYLKALQVRALIRRDFLDAFGEVDLLACPTAPGPAFRLGEKLDDPLQMYLQDVFTIPASLAGLPGLSLPCGFTAEG
ncbi:MAG: Asp-tRNA(Asn)/Glu-tRNA(Gln) amidotransferase subunit GatA, partial [Deltaproteobacteria bacterium]|nr:Asp-tRNA(Asn)/Glu-tRNA(Gln) amidotransferase subunit GatA [Deltaproteobacteria bacterium]